MKHFDVFNGDADGICSLHQLRLAAPCNASIVTGVKRDIALLERVPAGRGDTVTVLDISLDTNRSALLRLLDGGAAVRYFDHHCSGDVPRHARLEAHIDTSPQTCTGIIVDRHLGGAHRAWAVVAAFGDNLSRSAQGLAATLALLPQQVESLRDLGECINYNAYGDSETDLVVHPAALYAIVARHADPFGFIRDEPVLHTIRAARCHDLELARSLQPQITHACGKVFLLPDAGWSRRVRGAFGNLLANADPVRAHALLTPAGSGTYMVSVRAPLATMRGADILCRRFPGGGGRAAAAGINHLADERLAEFLQAFEQAFRLT